MSVEATASTELKQLRLIGEIVSHINLGKTFGEILDAVYTHVQEIMPVDRIAVGLVDRERDRLTFAAVRPDDQSQRGVGVRVPLQGTSLDGLLRRDEALILNDLGEASGSERDVYGEGMRASMTVPLTVRGDAIGALFLSSRAPGAFRSRHATFVRQVAGHLAMTIEKSRLIGLLESRNLALAESKALSERYVERLQAEVRRQTVELERSRERYRTLLAISNSMNENIDAEQMFDRIVDVLGPVLPIDRLGIVLLETGQARLFSLSPRGERPSLEADDIPLDGSYTGEVVRSGEIGYWPDLSGEDGVFEDHLVATGVRSFVVVPLRSKDETIGTMNVSSREANHFSKADLGFLEQLAEPVTLAVQNALAFREIDRLKNEALTENVSLRRELTRSPEALELRGGSPAMAAVRHAAARVGPTEATVLIRGETGTGKELVARAIHQHSPRAGNALVPVNCAALSESLIESELFGHEKGAFTGAAERRIGRFELADKGTIFLDEVGDLPPAVQVKLLRVLQEREFERVGGDTTIQVDVRVVAATNRDLEAAIRAGEFREDLFYRLNVFPMAVPALRERPDDIVELALHFLQRFSQKTGRFFRGITPATIERLRSYDWPGNVRELENVIERAVILGDGPELRIDAALLGGGSRGRRAGQLTLEELERRYITEILESTGGVVYGPAGAAKILGLKPTTLQSRMKKLGIDRAPGKKK